MHDTAAEPADPAEPGPGSTAAPSGGLGHAFVALIAAIWRALTGGVRRLRAWNKRDGAGDSGLAALVETHALQSAGDATIAVALAGSLFFSVSPDAARNKIGLYLLITMLPFAVIAPVIGPMLDRFRRGRRIALAVTMIARAVLALAIGHSLTHSGHTSATQALTLYPAALGVLVASKAYGVARSAAVPRLVPEGMTLVTANSRLTLAGVITPVAAGSVAAAVAKTLGSRTELFLGALVYVFASVMALRLPAAADGVEDDEAIPTEEVTNRTGGLVRRGQVTDEVRRALQCAAALRWLSGFMLFFGAFLVRIHPLAGLSANVCLGLLALSIAAGNILGTTLGPRTATIAARRLAVGLLGATTAICVVTIFYFGLVTMIALAVVGSAAAAVAKLALDGTIQRQIDEDVRTSVFARSETTLQLAWVVGGGTGILLPRHGAAGFAVAALVLGFALIVALGVIPNQRRGKQAAPSSTSAPSSPSS